MNITLKLPNPQQHERIFLDDLIQRYKLRLISAADYILSLTNIYRPSGYSPNLPDFNDDDNIRQQIAMLTYGSTSPQKMALATNAIVAIDDSHTQLCVVQPKQRRSGYCGTFPLVPRPNSRLKFLVETGNWERQKKMHL
jgi:hypothetical protein